LVTIKHEKHVVFSLAGKISVLARETVITEDLPENINGNPKVQKAYLWGPTCERDLEGCSGTDGRGVADHVGESASPW
jgi:hypothetical protein